MVRHINSRTNMIILLQNYTTPETYGAAVTLPQLERAQNDTADVKRTGLLSIRAYHPTVSKRLLLRWPRRYTARGGAAPTILQVGTRWR